MLRRRVGLPLGTLASLVIRLRCACGGPPAASSVTVVEFTRTLEVQKMKAQFLRVMLNGIKPLLELLFEVFEERCHDESDRSCEKNHYN
jgi:hypothetical protein